MSLRGVTSKARWGPAGALSAVSILSVLAPAPSALAQSGGAQIYQQNCAVCHSLSPGVSAAAPSVFDIVGRKAGSRNFSYSDALRGRALQGLVWNEANLKAWILGPAIMIPGTSMGFPGLRSAEDADALIAYLKSNP